ncbi:hypothetical protein MMC07_005821 [Pseudocyphellaria aurata]|nr:hypothetical protein [Pseudocyphellaria aurata]
MQQIPLGSNRNEAGTQRQAAAAGQAVKPLPPLPRGWSRVCHETGLFLRGIGLGIVVSSVQGVLTRNFLEPKKVAIRLSRLTALLRTLIHVIPLGIAIFEIIFNFKGRFVGGHFDKQSYLQFAAKAHEIAIQASVATILFSYIRHQISTGRGMPFGAVLGGLQFLQVSYLWSVEFWSSILSKEFEMKKKIGFVGLTLICVTVAATAGPSSAGLLIPRQGLSATAPRYLAVNASALDIWPDRLDDMKLDGSCAVARYGYIDPKLRCPISDLYELLTSDLYQRLSGRADVGFMGSIGSKPMRPLTSTPCLRILEGQICTSVPQAELIEGFYLVGENDYKEPNFDIYRFMQKNLYQPYSAASCVADVVNDATEQDQLRFARIRETYADFQKERDVVSIPGLTKGQIINKMLGDDSDFHIQWVDLPTEVFSTGIPGAVIVNFRDSNGSLYDIITCTLNAGWGSSSIMSFSSYPHRIWTHTSNTPSLWHTKKDVVDPYGYIYSNPPIFATHSNFSYPQRRISISKNWMEFLNPTFILANNSTEKFISLVLSTVQSPPTEAIAAQLMSVLLAGALSNTGTEYDWAVFDELNNATRSCDNCLVLEIEGGFYGWLYSASGRTTQLALAIMLSYVLLALGHIIYSAISGISSTAWDSVGELVALTVNSSPSKVLQNTCAGIVGRQALKTNVRVLATTPGHLELVFGEIEDPTLQASELVMNEKYGTLTDEDDVGIEEPESNGQRTLRKRFIAQTLE